MCFFHMIQGIFLYIFKYNMDFLYTDEIIVSKFGQSWVLTRRYYKLIIKHSPGWFYKDYKDLQFIFTWFHFNKRNRTNHLKSVYIIHIMTLLINTTRFWSLSTQVSLTLLILCQDGTKCCHTGKILRYTIVIEIDN